MSGCWLICLGSNDSILNHILYISFVTKQRIGSRNNKTTTNDNDTIFSEILPFLHITMSMIVPIFWISKLHKIATYVACP
jgi:hypothetical protein